MSRRVLVGLQVVAAWTALAVFFAVSASLTYITQGRPPLWGLSLAYALAQWWLWAALTPVVLGAARRWPLAGPRWHRHVILHLVAGLVVAYTKVVLEGLARQWLFDAVPYLVISNLALQVLIYWALVAFAHALDQYGRSRTRAAEAETQLHAARLQLLRGQLQPHFLFNALNALSELVHEDPDRADRMIDGLTGLLRASLDVGDRQEVPLDDELALLERYLAIQAVRYEGRLRVVWEIAPGAGRMAVPHLLLQPLAENAIEHGLGPRPDGGTIVIRAGVAGDRLTLSVADDGVGVRPDAGEGVGLANTRARLASLYGAAATLSIGPAEGGGTVVTVTQPARGDEGWHAGAGG